MLSLRETPGRRAALQLTYGYAAAVDNAARSPQLLGQRSALPTYPQVLLLIGVLRIFLFQAAK
jgi:hypothetical protein